MFARLFARQVWMPIGCALSENALKLVQFDSVSRSSQVIASASQPLDMLTADNVVAWRASLATALERALAQGDFKGRQAVLCLPWSQMAYRRLRMAAMPADEMPTAVRWRVAKELALPISAFESDYYDVGPAEDQGRRCHDVICVTAQSSDVEIIVNAFEQAGLTTIAVDAAAGALARALETGNTSTQSQSSCLVVEVGVQSSCVMVMRQGRPCFIRTIPGGRQQIVQRAASRLGLESQAHASLWQMLQSDACGAVATNPNDASDGSDSSDTTARMRSTLSEVTSLHAAELAHEVMLCTHYMAGLAQSQNQSQNQSAGSGGLVNSLIPQRGCIVGAGAQEAIFLSKFKDVCDVMFEPLEQMFGPSLGMALTSIDALGSLDSWLTAAGLALYDTKSISMEKCA